MGTYDGYTLDTCIVCVMRVIVFPLIFADTCIHRIIIYKLYGPITAGPGAPREEIISAAAAAAATPPYTRLRVCIIIIRARTHTRARTDLTPAES